MAGEKLPSKWVYGGIFPGTGCYSVIYGAEKEDFTGADIEKHTVYSDTVGQYTGLTDKNGKRIFEGDIIKGVDTDIIRTIEYHENRFVLVSKLRRFFDVFYSEDWEIIGNIHDNPELLGGEENE